MTPAETPVNPYPMLTRLLWIFTVRASPVPSDAGAFLFADSEGWNHKLLTPAEVLALADELRRMVQTQEPK